MKPEFLEHHVEKHRVSVDFRISDALAGPLGVVFEGKRPPTALPPFQMSSYQGQGLISVTYDDGLLDNFIHAAPLHLKHGIPASFAVIAKCLIRSSGNPRFMTPEMCRVLHDLGFEISSHGLLHCKRLLDMTLRELHQDTHLSKTVIEQLIGVPDAVTSYCVPFSRVRPLHVNYLHKVYSVVRTAGNQMNELPFAERARVSSYPLTRHTSFKDVRQLIDSAIENRTALVLLLHGICRHDARPAEFELSTNMLNQILDYVAQQGPQRLLPVRLSTLPLMTKSNVSAARRRSQTFGMIRTMRDKLASLRS
jgi:peptidoglycan/xylan/chitin deacetylase (PgdA/CDA1 family)